MNVNVKTTNSESTTETMHHVEDARDFIQALTNPDLEFLQKCFAASCYLGMALTLVHYWPH